MKEQASSFRRVFLPLCYASTVRWFVCSVTWANLLTLLTLQHVECSVLYDFVLLHCALHTERNNNSIGARLDVCVLYCQSCYSVCRNVSILASSSSVYELGK